ncbi:MAG: terminase [Gammaproteobacteria bacterium]|nr:terminase [Gammaproteobacteria bacterium]
MAGLTQKQEKFCQLFIETGNASEAYRKAYDASRMKAATINRKAKEVLDNGKITARLNVLRAEHRQRHDVTVDSLTEELEQARTLALAEKQSSAAVSASMGKAKLHGLIVDKNEHTGKDGAPLVPVLNVTISPES